MQLAFSAARELGSTESTHRQEEELREGQKPVSWDNRETAQCGRRTGVSVFALDDMAGFNWLL